MSRADLSRWDSDFFDTVYANPAPDPLRELKEVTNTSVLGSAKVLSIKSLKASCQAIVKLSQEGSTYYSSVREGSSLDASSSYNPTDLLPPQDKVARWVASAPYEPAPIPGHSRITLPPPPVGGITSRERVVTSREESSTSREGAMTSREESSTSRERHSINSDEKGRDPPQPAISSSHADPRLCNLPTSPTRRPNSSSIPVSSEVGIPRRPKPATPRATSQLTPEDRTIIEGLRMYASSPDQVKIYLKNVPNTPHSKEQMKRRLLEFVPSVRELVHDRDMMIAVADRRGSEDFRDSLSGTILHGCQTPLVVVLIG